MMLNVIPRPDSYIIVKADGSTCPSCGRTVDLLARSSLEGPSFYLCSCGFVGEVGVAKLRTGTQSPDVTIRDLKALLAETRKGLTAAWFGSPLLAKIKAALGEDE